MKYYFIFWPDFVKATIQYYGYNTIYLPRIFDATGIAELKTKKITQFSLSNRICVDLTFGLILSNIGMLYRP